MRSLSGVRAFISIAHGVHFGVPTARRFASKFANTVSVLCLHNVLQAEMLVEEGKITKPRRHEQPPLGQAGRDVDDTLQPALAGDLRLLTRLSR